MKTNVTGADQGERERIKQRLEELKREQNAGNEQILALENRTRELRNTLLRIAGAIQVLEEMLAASEAP